MKKPYVSVRTQRLTELRHKMETQISWGEMDLYKCFDVEEYALPDIELVIALQNMSQDLDELHVITRYLDEITVNVREIRRALPEESL